MLEEIRRKCAGGDKRSSMLEEIRGEVCWRRQE
jgi:hypothetical protein